LKFGKESSKPCKLIALLWGCLFSLVGERGMGGEVCRSTNLKTKA
jgi:hypothetical protein